MRNERGLSALDKTHKYSLGWLYELPKAGFANSFVNGFLTGWQMNGNYVAETGQAITPLSGVDANGNLDSAGDRAVVNPGASGLRGTGVNFVVRDSVTGQTSISTTNPGSSLVVGYIAKDPSARFVVAQAGAVSTAGRDIIRSPGLNNWNFAILKDTRVAEGKKIQFRFELYNAFNHRQYSLGLGTYQTFNSNALSTSYANVSAQNFLNPLQFSGGNRVIQYGLKFIF